MSRSPGPRRGRASWGGGAVVTAARAVRASGPLPPPPPPPPRGGPSRRVPRASAAASVSRGSRRRRRNRRHRSPCPSGRRRRATSPVRRRTRRVRAWGPDAAGGRWARRVSQERTGVSASAATARPAAARDRDPARAPACRAAWEAWPRTGAREPDRVTDPATAAGRRTYRPTPPRPPPGPVNRAAPGCGGRRRGCRRRTSPAVCRSRRAARRRVSSGHRRATAFAGPRLRPGSDSRRRAGRSRSPHCPPHIRAVPGADGVALVPVRPVQRVRHGGVSP